MVNLKKLSCRCIPKRCSRFLCGSTRRVGRCLFTLGAIVHIFTSCVLPIYATGLLQHNSRHEAARGATQFLEYDLFDDYYYLFVPCCVASVLWCICGLIGLKAEFAQVGMFMFVTGQGIVLFIVIYYTLWIYSGDYLEEILYFDIQYEVWAASGSGTQQNKGAAPYFWNNIHHFERDYECCGLGIIHHQLYTSGALSSTCCPPNSGKCTNKNRHRDNCRASFRRAIHTDFGKMRWALWIFIISACYCFGWGLCYYLTLFPYDKDKTGHSEEHINRDEDRKIKTEVEVSTKRKYY